jgi:hypothetical protein
VRAQAKGQGLAEQKVLADWVVGAPPGEVELACLTAVRAAAKAGQTPADFFQKVGGRDVRRRPGAGPGRGPP